MCDNYPRASDDTLRPHRRATEESLDFSEQVAKHYGAEYDREATRDLASRLHDHYFEELCRIINFDANYIRFDAASFKVVSAGVSRDTSGFGLIEFDEELDFWITSFCQLTTILACKQLQPDAYQEAIEVFALNIEVRRNPDLSWSVASRDKSLVASHMDCLELSHALARSMVVFVLCHEIAHLELGHLDEPASLDQEYAADAYAFDLFMGVVGAGPSAKGIFVSPKLVCVPLLLMRFFQMTEAIDATLTVEPPPPPSSHPSGLERHAALKSLVTPHMNDTAMYILDGFEITLLDIAVQLDIKGFRLG